MKPRPLDLRALAVIAVGITLVAGACTRTRSGVSVKSLAANLVFGVPPLPESVPPPNIDLVPDEPIGITTLGTPKKTPAKIPPFTPTPACPEAAPTEFPEREATTDVPARPKEGSYRWVVAGEQATASGTFKLPEFVQRNITSVTGAGQGEFSFAATERELVVGSSTIVTSYFEVVPDDGIYLTKIVRKTGTRERVLAPTPPILYLPLPVRIGLPVSSVGVSESGAFGEVLRHTGTVKGRHRVDACGKVIDSWLVEGTQEFVSSEGGSTQKKYNYGIATQLGGFIVFEHVESPSSSPSLLFDARLGQVEPSSLREIY